jgi:glycopeptide antibiotics resistance protein
MFKFPFHGDELGSVRAIELIPFYVDEIKDEAVYKNNLLYNFLFFVPFGVYASLLKPERSTLKKTAPIALTSLSYEVLQYILGVGISDVTDLITNTLGGIAGIGLYHVIQSVFKTRTTAVVNAVALTFTVVVLAMFGWSLVFMIR